MVLLPLVTTTQVFTSRQNLLSSGTLPRISFDDEITSGTAIIFASALTLNSPPLDYSAPSFTQIPLSLILKPRNLPQLDPFLNAPQ